MVIVRLPPVTVWILLIVLIFWDLCAVLTPCGPLRLLIELIHARNKQGSDIKLPDIMIYSTMARHDEDQRSLDESESESDKIGATRKFSEFKPKLGMGDFVFYSILVGKSAMEHSLVTTVFCILSILFGLICTLCLLVIYGRALPALPISLTIALVNVGIMVLCGEDFGEALNVKMIAL